MSLKFGRFSKNVSPFLFLNRFEKKKRFWTDKTVSFEDSKEWKELLFEWKTVSQDSSACHAKLILEHMTLTEKSMRMNLLVLHINRLVFHAKIHSYIAQLKDPSLDASVWVHPPRCVSPYQCLAVRAKYGNFPGKNLDFMIFPAKKNAAGTVVPGKKKVAGKLSLAKKWLQGNCLCASGRAVLIFAPKYTTWLFFYYEKCDLFSKNEFFRSLRNVFQYIP